ncbi:MAG TPA: hypothetical protein VH575_04150, partial [Gemmataceae bacterium]
PLPMMAGSEAPAILLPGAASVAGQKGEIARAYWCGQRCQRDTHHGKGKVEKVERSGRAAARAYSLRSGFRRDA